MFILGIWTNVKYKFTFYDDKKSNRNDRGKKEDWRARQFKWSLLMCHTDDTDKRFIFLFFFFLSHMRVSKSVIQTKNGF